MEDPSLDQSRQTLAQAFEDPTLSSLYLYLNIYQKNQYIYIYVCVCVCDLELNW